MKYVLHISQSAENDLRDMEKHLAKHILDKLGYFSFTKNPLYYAKPLKGTLKGLYRFRIGEYRALFNIDTKGRITILVVLRIKHRSEVYE